MKTKILAFLILILLLSGCGITQGSIKTPDKEIHFIMGKEYDSFILDYKNGEVHVHIEAKKVGAVEGQKLISKGVGKVGEGIVKGFLPIP